MAHYSKEDCTFILKTLSAGVVDSLGRGYDFDGLEIYEHLNTWLNKAVANANAHSKKLVAELMLKLNKFTNDVDVNARHVNDATHIDIFVAMIRNVVIGVIDSFEVVRNEILMDSDGYPIHVVDVAFTYDATVWLITVTDQDMSDKYEMQYRLNGDIGAQAQLAEDDVMVLSLLAAISSLTAVEKEVELMIRVAAADPAIVQKAEEIQKLFGKSVEEHLEVALIFHSLTDYSAMNTDEAKNMAVYIRQGTNCSPQQAVNPSFIQSEFGFSKDQAVAISKIFRKRNKGLGWKLFTSKDEQAEAKVYDDLPVIDATYKDVANKDIDE